MPKSADAFRTISEVADWLGVQAHVLRFWESKFAQVKPIKRAGGRRYYRPADMLLLGGIKKLLHDDGLTIKGAQKLLREKGVAFVADQSQPLDDLTMAVIEGSPVSDEPADAEIFADATAELESNADEPAEDAPAEPLPDVAEEPEPVPTETEAEPEPAEPEVSEPEPAEAEIAAPEPVEPEPEPEQVASDASDTEQADTTEDGSVEPEQVVPSFRARPRSDAQTSSPAEEKTSEPQEADVPTDVPHEADSIPASLEEIAPEAPAFTPSEPPPPPKPRIINLPPIPDISEIDASPSALSALSKAKQLSPDQAQSIRPLLARLTRLRASMGNPRKEIRKD